MGKTVARVINLVDNLDQINFGIWNAAIATAEVLEIHFGITSQLWYPQPQSPAPDYQFTSVETVPVTGKGKDAFNKCIRNLNPDTDIVVSHGCWQWPTLWGNWFQRAGFRWMYVPHGMLEPWSMQQKSWKKKPYFLFIERPKAAKAQIIRAVGAPEAENLKSYFNQVVLIPNGVPASAELPDKADFPIQYLYMARLHFKKGPLQLAKAWKASELCNDPQYKLSIVGPDEGELDKIMGELAGVSNAEVLGPVYGEAKTALLQQTHYYVLPSLSEGFPTAVVEAMMYGLVPIISQGCNFPEVFEQDLGYDSGTTYHSIKLALEQTVADWQNWKKKQLKGHQLVLQDYSIEAIAALQVKVFKSL